MVSTDETLFSRFSYLFSSKLLVIAISVATTPILVRLLGSSDYGDLSFLISLLEVAIVVINFGLFDSVRKYISEERQETIKWESKVFSFYLKLAIGLALFGIFLILLANYFGYTTVIIPPELHSYIYLICLIILARQFFSTVRSALMGLELEIYSEPLRVVNKFIFGLVSLTLLYLGWGITGVLIGHIISSLVGGIFGFIILSSSIDVRQIPLKSNIDKKPLINYNVFSVLFIFLTISLYHIDVILLRLITGSTTTGYYKAALVVAEFAWVLPITFQRFLLHTSSKMWVEDNIDKISDIASKAFRYNLMITLIVVVGLIALADSFIVVYFGGEYEAAVSSMILLLPGIIFFSLSRPIYSIGQGEGSLRILCLASGVAAVVNLLLNILLIPRYGMEGAATATSIGYGTMFFCHLVGAQIIGFNPLDETKVFRIGTASVITLGLLIIFDNLIKSNFFSLTILTPLGLLFYVKLLSVTDAITDDELSSLKSKVPIF